MPCWMVQFPFEHWILVAQDKERKSKLIPGPAGLVSEFDATKGQADSLVAQDKERKSKLIPGPAGLATKLQCSNGNWTIQHGMAVR